MRIYNRQIVGLDIQDKRVKCVQIRRSSGSWEIQKVLQRDIEFSGDAEDSEASQNQVAYIIKSILQDMGSYPPKNLVTCIRGRESALKLLELPSLVNKKVAHKEAVIRYELVSILPVNIDQMSYDYTILEEDYQHTRVLSASAKRSTIDRHLNTLSTVGIYPDIVTTTPIALFNTFAGRDPESIRVGNICLISLRDTEGDVVVCEDGRLTYARSFGFSASSSQQIAREIHNSFDAYASSRSEENPDSFFTGHPISQIYLLVDEGKLPGGLSEDNLQSIYPEAKWKVQPARDDIAYGIAITGAYSAVSTRSAPLRINLIERMTQEKMMAHKKARKAKLVKLAPIMAAIFLFILSLALWWQVYESGREIELLNGMHEDDRQRVELITQLKETELDIQKHTEVISWAGKGHPMVSYRLYQISRAIPQEVWLKEVYIPEVKVSRRKKSEVRREAISEMYVSGYAYSQSHIGEFLDGLRGCDCFPGVKQESTQEVTLSGERVLEFTIHLNSETEN